jgi:hypothetical protein
VVAVCGNSRTPIEAAVSIESSGMAAMTMATWFHQGYT